MRWLIVNRITRVVRLLLKKKARSVTTEIQGKPRKVSHGLHLQVTGSGISY